MRLQLALTMLIGPAALGAVACADSEQPQVIEEEIAGEQEVAQDSVARVSQIEPETILLREPESFPHSEHRSIECTNCHQAVPSHTTHVGVTCTHCHTVPAQFAALRVLTDQECMTCHHSTEHGYSCETCHERQNIVETGSVTKPLQLPGWEDARPRQLAFSHETHAEQQCGDCHAAPPTAENVVDCTTCHENHHRIDANCSACHLEADVAVHREKAHLGCSGSGCHVDTAITAFPPTRPVCLMCHADKAEHEPQQPNCAQCHAINTWRTVGSTESGQP